MQILFFTVFLAFLGLCMFGIDLLIRRTAYDRKARYLHGRLIIAVLLVELLAANVFTISFPMMGVDAVINSSLLAPFFDVVLPKRAYELLYMLLVLFGLNILLMLMILAAILVTRFLFRRQLEYRSAEDFYGAERLLHPAWLLAYRYYSDEEQEGRLNSRGYCAKIWADGMKNVFLLLWILEVILLAVSVLWGGEVWNERLRAASKAWYLLPMAAYLLVEQFALFLEGEAEESEAGSFQSASVDERLTGDMEKLLNAFRGTFRNSGVLLYSEAGEYRTQGRDGLNSNDLDNQQLRDCLQPDVLSFLSSQLRESGVQQCDAYQNALVALLNGESIHVRDQKDGEFLIYLAAYLNNYLSQGRTALVLCRNAEDAHNVCSGLEQCLADLNSLYNVWSVRESSGINSAGRMDVLVCSWAELSVLNLSEKQSDFEKDLFSVCIMDAFSLFTQDGIHIEQVFNELRKSEKTLQYILISGEDNENLRNAAESTIRQSLAPFNHDVKQRNTSIMIWKEESRYKLQRYIGVGGDMSPYMGTALPLALVAVRYDLPQVYLVSDPGRGDKTFKSTLSMGTKEIMHYLGRTVNLESIIRWDPKEFMGRQDVCMALVYDTEYNMINALWRWMKYGGSDGTLLHVISPPYLLRDFMAANFRRKKLLLKNHEFDALIPYSRGLDISHRIGILTALSGGGLTREQLMERSSSYGWRYENEEKLLEDCLRVVLRKEEVHSVYDCFRFEEIEIFDKKQENFLTCTYITLSDPGIKKRILEQASFGKWVSGSGPRADMDVLSGNLHNYYLRGQIAAFEGYLYKITGVKDGCVYAEKEMPQSLPQYYPISCFRFQKYEQLDSGVDYSFVDMDLCRARVSRTILGYWASTQGNDFATPGGVLFNKLINDDGEGITQRIENAGVLEFSFHRAQLGERWREVANLFAFLLGELSRTLFPTIWQNLFVVTDGCPDSELMNRVLQNGEDSDLNDRIRSTIPWAENEDEAAPEDDQYATVYAVEFSCVEYGMVQMIYSKRESIFRMMHEYLSWYLGADRTAGEGEPAQGAEPGYLHFGAEKIPDLFEPQELMNVLDRLSHPTDAPVGEELSETDGGKRCTFCGRPVLFTYDMGDGRCMCRDCKSHQLSRRDEIKSLYFETIHYMEKSYGISLRKNIHVRFQSADAIRKAVNGGYNGRVLGFYNNRSRQLWLESRGPKIAIQSTLLHELTHSWQHDQLNIHALTRKFPRKDAQRNLLLLLEGHAMYVEVDAMRRLNELEYADRIHAETMSRTDEYGIGYRLLYDYIRAEEEKGSHMNAFTAMEQLVADVIEGRKVIENAT